MPAPSPRGIARSAVRIHEVTAELDAGPVLGQARVAVRAGDTAETLAARVLAREQVLYPMVLRRFVAGERAPLTI